MNRRRNFWGSQAASLQLPAACRQHFREANCERKNASRQAAQTNRLAACAPQNAIIATPSQSLTSEKQNSRTLSSPAAVIFVGFGLAPKIFGVFGSIIHAAH